MDRTYLGLHGPRRRFQSSLKNITNLPYILPDPRLRARAVLGPNIVPDLQSFLRLLIFLSVHSKKHQRQNDLRIVLEDILVLVADGLDGLGAGGSDGIIFPFEIPVLNFREQFLQTRFFRRADEMPDC